MTALTCTFPELQSHADHDLVAIAAIGEDIPAIEVSINNPRKPLFLYLESVQPKKWKIRYTNKTKILGVAVRSNSIDADEVWGLDRSTPLYVGEGCNGYIDFRGGAPKVARRSQNSKPSDPFGTAAPPHPLIVEGYKISVGDPIQNTDNPPPLAGRDALEDLVSKGKIQRSNSQIFSMWIAQEVNRWSLFKKLPKKVPPFWDGYVYPDDRWIDLPNRLRGPDAPVLFVFGNSELIGDRGDATIFFLTTSQNTDTRNTGCIGPLC